MGHSIRNSKETDMPGTMKYITLEEAKKAMAAAEAEARKNNWNVCIAILDAGANLVLFQKMDDTQLGSVKISVGKAQTAVNFKRPTKALEDLIAGGRQVFLAVEGITPLQGGLPVMVDGKLIGAVGVSGVMSNQDEQVAQAAVNVLQGMS
jgi:glc operon protein GlcG